MFFRNVLPFVLILFILPACSHQPKVIETSKQSKAPEWTQKSFHEEDGRVCFSGAYFSGRDYPLAVRCANAEALKVAVQSLSQFIRAEFTEYVHGSDSVDRYVEDGIATFSRGVHIQGLQQAEVYHEKTLEYSEPRYDVWVRLEMDKQDYQRCKAEALRELRDRFRSAGEEEAKDKAEQLLRELKDEA